MVYVIRANLLIRQLNSFNLRQSEESGHFLALLRYLKITKLHGDSELQQILILLKEKGLSDAIESLNISDNGLKRLPAEIGDLCALKELNIHGNQLIALPPEIGNLFLLQELRAASNQLTVLPKKIGHLLNLRTLDLQDNQLTELPEMLRNCRQIENFWLDNNPLPKSNSLLLDLLRGKPIITEQMLKAQWQRDPDLIKSIVEENVSNVMDKDSAKITLQYLDNDVFICASGTMATRVSIIREILEKYKEMQHQIGNIAKDSFTYAILPSFNRIRNTVHHEVKKEEIRNCTNK